MNYAKCNVPPRRSRAAARLRNCERWVRVWFDPHATARHNKIRRIIPAESMRLVTASFAHRQARCAAEAIAERESWPYKRSLRVALELLTEQR